MKRNSHDLVHKRRQEPRRSDARPGERERSAAPPAAPATLLRSLRSAAVPLVVAAALAGCNGQRTDFGVSDDETAAALDSIALLEPVDDAAGRAGSVADGPDEIYYDLTAFEWYRRGEPLRVDGLAYSLAGGPEATRARRFERVGEYQGVAYYVEEDAPEPYATVYIPVYPGYWLPFSAREPAPRPAE